MWKVVVIICALGNPCMVFQEDPPKYYYDKSECMAVAAEKEQLMIQGYNNYGYTVEKNAHTCELKHDVNSV
jgi:hypothetical protein